MAEPTVIASNIEHVDTALLHEHPRNPRQGDVGAIVTSIERNGFFDPLVVQRTTGHVLSGNHRLRAAHALRMQSVPVVWVDVDDAQAHRILLAANRLNDLAAYDDTALAELLREVATTDDLLGTGYDGDDLDELLLNGPPLPDGPDGRGGAADEPRDIAGVDFRFGDYSGKISAPVYDSFIAALEQHRADSETVLLDDVLVAWLAL